MYTASQEFHDAVANGAHQIALLIFDDAVFTNDDINVTNGIEFNDYFNTEEDLTIGQALSNEIRFSVFNDHGLLDEYEFGDFTATIGAQTGNETVTANGTIQVQSASHTYVAYSASPYLKRDGTAVSNQPAREIVSMLVYNGLVYCLLNNNAVIAYKDSNGATQSVNVNSFMKAQMAKWAGKGIAYTKASGENWKLRIWKGTNLRTYEFVPLGRFMAERPNVPTVNEINFTCYDLMQRFEKDVPADTQLEDAYIAKYGGNYNYPVSLMKLLKAVCAYANVPIDSSTASSFINSSATISARPDEFDNATMREVIQWLAEAAGSVARFTRDGELKFDWLHLTGPEMDENGYIEFRPYWYEVVAASGLVNRAADGSYNNVIGMEDDGYLIQDNPLLKGVT